MTTPTRTTVLPPNSHDFAASNSLSIGAGPAWVAADFGCSNGADGSGSTGCPGATSGARAGSGNASLSGTTGGSTGRGGASADRAGGGGADGSFWALTTHFRSATSRSNLSSRREELACIRKTIAPSRTSKRTVRVPAAVPNRNSITSRLSHGCSLGTVTCPLRHTSTLPWQDSAADL